MSVRGGEPSVLLRRHLEPESPPQYFHVCIYMACVLMAQLVPSVVGGRILSAGLLSFSVASLELTFYCWGGIKGSETYGQWKAKGSQDLRPGMEGWVPAVQNFPVVSYPRWQSKCKLAFQLPWSVDTEGKLSMLTWNRVVTCSPKIFPILNALAFQQVCQSAL